MVLKGKKVLLGISIGYVLYAGRFWKGFLLVADVEELKHLDASEMHARRFNAKEVLMPKKEGRFVLHVADESVKLAGRDQVFRKSTSLQDHNARREEHNDGSYPSDHQ